MDTFERFDQNNLWVKDDRDVNDRQWTLETNNPSGTIIK